MVFCIIRNDPKIHNTLWCRVQRRLNNWVLERTALHQSSSSLCRRSGVVYVADREAGFGLASQESWIQHASVRDNILFGKDYDPAFYQAVIEACALSDDLNVRLLPPLCLRLFLPVYFLPTASLHITVKGFFPLINTWIHNILTPISLGTHWAFLMISGQSKLIESDIIKTDFSFSAANKREVCFAYSLFWLFNIYNKLVLKRVFRFCQMVTRQKWERTEWLWAEDRRLDWLSPELFTWSVLCTNLPSALSTGRHGRGFTKQTSVSLQKTIKKDKSTLYRYTVFILLTLKNK